MGYFLEKSFGTICKVRDNFREGGGGGECYVRTIKANVFKVK